MTPTPPDTDIWSGADISSGSTRAASIAVAIGGNNPTPAGVIAAR